MALLYYLLIVRYHLTILLIILWFVIVNLLLNKIIYFLLEPVVLFIISFYRISTSLMLKAFTFIRLNNVVSVEVWRNHIKVSLEELYCWSEDRIIVYLTKRFTNCQRTTSTEANNKQTQSIQINSSTISKKTTFLDLLLDEHLS